MRIHETVLLFALCSAAALSGCGDPCQPTFTADTLLIAPVFIDCEADTDTSTGESTGDSSTTTEITGTGTSTSDASSTTADPVSTLDPKPDAMPVCIAIPAPGEAWGPCIGGQCADGLFCKVTAMGDVCLSACDVPGPCDTDKCLGGTCDMGLGACIAPCKAAGDPCPLPGMECFFGASPLCAHQF